MYSLLKRLLIGSPLSSEVLEEQRLSKRVALAVFGTDAVASTAFATQEILVVLVPAAGMAALDDLVPISLVVIALLVIVTASYRQTLYAYPSGGGSYIVSRENLGAGASLTVASNGVMNIQSATVFQGAVTNFGTVNWLAGSVAINTNSGTTGVFWNEPGALFDIQCSQNFFFGLSLPTFHNAGLIRKEIVPAPPPSACSLTTLAPSKQRQERSYFPLARTWAESSKRTAARPFLSVAGRIA